MNNDVKKYSKKDEHDNEVKIITILKKPRNNEAFSFGIFSVFVIFVFQEIQKLFC